MNFSLIHKNRKFNITTKYCKHIHFEIEENIVKKYKSKNFVRNTAIALYLNVNLEDAVTIVHTLDNISVEQRKILTKKIN
jgi:hypothetical protein